MKVPKYIEIAIRRRAKAAMLLTENDVIISNWCEKNGIELKEYDICGGCESLVNPIASANRILKAIQNK